MAKSKWTKLYEWFDNLKAPDWLSAMLYELQLILWNITLEVGKDYIESVKEKIISVAKEDISNKEKFDKVYNYAKTLGGITIKDRYLHLIIESTVNFLKEKEII